MDRQEGEQYLDKMRLVIVTCYTYNEILTVFHSVRSSSQLYSKTFTNR